MRRRRGRAGRVLAEIPANDRDGSRTGALSRGELRGYSRLAEALAGARVVLALGPAKSDAALGLATVATSEGRRVALLEADLAAPSLAGRLGLAATPGLHEYLRGDVDAQQVLQALVLAGPASAGATQPLVCVVAGEPVTTALPLLESERCRGAIERLAAAYDLVVIEGISLGGDIRALNALVSLADVTVACGTRSELPKRPADPIAGLVVIG
jgi:Mrp family chromosome partitioning ATPase